MLDIDIMYTLILISDDPFIYFNKSLAEVKKIHFKLTKILIYDEHCCYI